MSSVQDPRPPTADMSDEEKLAAVKELYGRGSRNYLVKEYAQAADDLSEACALYAEIYGEGAQELGMPYLLYAKSLIALAQGGENKLLDVPEEQEDDDEDDEDEGSEEASVANGDAAGLSNGKTANGTSNGSAEPQAGGSSGAGAPETENTDGADEEEEDDTPAANLQVAWEVLELAVKIFQQGGEASSSNLADAYFELAEISLENSHFDTAVRDYNNSLQINMKLPDNNLRLIAEIQYKIGLSNLMLDAYDVSIVAFRKACEVLDAEIANQQTEPAQPERAEDIIAELRELKVEILTKITEVEEAQQQSVAEVKEEMAKLLSTGLPSSTGSTSSGAFSTGGNAGSSAGGSSSSSSGASAAAPRANDISHLIKRKNPTAPTTDDNKPAEGSPAKKQAL